MSAVAVVTDIHANLPALEAALRRIDDLGIRRIYCGGDLVGYGPRPNEVCALIEERELSPSADEVHAPILDPEVRVF